MDPLSLVLQPPVFYPIVPYVCTIFGGLRPGRMILIQGSVGSSANRFQVDFQCGCSTRPRSDVAFHFNPRFSSSNAHIICNTLRKDQWLDELKCSDAPLQKGDSFVLLFLFLADKVKVSIGGKHFLDFSHRLPLNDVDTLGIYGDVVVKEISFLTNNPFKADLTPYPECQPLKHGHADPQNTPLSKLFPTGLKENQAVTVRGLVTVNPDEITFLLKSKDSIPFRLIANFEDESLCYSHFMGQSWKEPQVIETPFFVFYAERFFEILILPEAGLLRLAINGTPLGNFCPPGLNVKAIDELQIKGSAMLYTVEC
ncbi:galectin-12 [Gastrophryne carolinensis]